MALPQAISETISIAQAEGKPSTVKCYQGLEGVKQAYLDTLDIAENTTIYAFLNPDRVDPSIYEWLTTEYVRLRVEKKIFAHVFISNGAGSAKTEQYLKKDTGELRETHMVESFDHPFECEVDIIGYTVFFINYNPKETLMAVSITDPMIVKTIKSFYLHYLWKM